MTHFKKIAVVSRLSSPKELEQIKKIIDFLIEKYNSDIYVNEEFAKHFDNEKSIKITQINKFDLIIAFGGDGTILWISRYSDEVPLFGINAGHLGFLTSTTLENYQKQINRVFNNDCIIEKCMRLKVTLDGKELASALNESYTTNSLIARICQINIFVNDFDLGCHLLDGLLVSTPVGSTAYALSAGGSIIEHTIKAMQIVPVNSVSRRIRPFVVPSNTKITIKVPETFKSEVVVMNDGLLEGTFKKDSILEITKAKNETVFIRFPEYSFINRLKDKLDF